MGNCCGSGNEAAEDNTMFYDGDGNCYLWDDDIFQVREKRFLTFTKLHIRYF